MRKLVSVLLTLVVLCGVFFGAVESYAAVIEEKISDELSPPWPKTPRLWRS